jgi:hypothetical protein
MYNKIAYGQHYLYQRFWNNFNMELYLKFVMSKIEKESNSNNDKNLNTKKSK